MGKQESLPLLMSHKSLKLNMSESHAYFMNHLCYSDIRLIERLELRFPPHHSRKHLEEHIMAITRWDPFREVVALQNRVNSLFRDLNEGDDPVATASFVPALDRKSVG